MLISATISDAWQAAERMRHAVEALRIDENGRQVPARVSIGLAVGQTGDRSCEEALQRADSALYAAKLTGRNRVRAAEPNMPCRPAAMTC